MSAWGGATPRTAATISPPYRRTKESQAAFSPRSRTSGKPFSANQPASAPRASAKPASARSGQGSEEVIALVVDDNEGRKIDDLDAPDRLHAELGIFDQLDLLDAV